MKLLFTVLSLLTGTLLYGQVITGAMQTERYVNLLKNRNVGIVGNQTSLIENTHIVDSLLSLNINVKKIFCPEHGFRGNADAGSLIKDNTDEKSGLPVVSLYGANKKPSKDQLDGLDVLVFDIQDVGVRFYTYISTLHYLMEACAENEIELIVLDRPNPNGFYVDGPVLDSAYFSFVGMHRVPLVHGMTVGEYAQMINGEKWLKNGLQCKLTVIPCSNYNHLTRYELPVKPSPNLPNEISVRLYPSLGLFEGTIISVGRGTDFPFQVIGHPQLSGYSFSFIPQSVEGAKNPPLKGQSCHGLDLRNDSSIFTLKYIIEFYKAYPNKSSFFTPFFAKLIGNTWVKDMIIKGFSEADIKERWAADIEEFKIVRKQYLLYDDFE